MGKRYRYITCGLVSPDEHVNKFRLIGSSNLAGDDGIRIELPDDIKLEKWSCDSYSTTEDERTIRELNPVVMVRINNKLVHHKELEKEWLNGKVQPHEFDEWIITHTKHGADMREPEEIIGIGNADKMRKLFDNLIKAMDGESKGEKGTE